MLNAAIIGFGGIAQAHKNGYSNLEKEGKARLAATYDIDPGAYTRKGIDIEKANADPNGIHYYLDLDEMFAKEKIDFVDVCVPSYEHCRMACIALERGYHVISEKPMALCAADCDKMLETAKKAGVHHMTAQCVRFFPEYMYLKEAKDSGKYGKVISALFSRVSGCPSTTSWYGDYDKCGGGMSDLHIHDIDFIRYMFGEPEAVSCRSSAGVTKHDAMQTALYYGGLPVTAISDRTLAGMGFSATFRVGFEGATFILDRDGFKVYPKDGTAPFTPGLNAPDGYTGEISYFCDVITGRRPDDVNPSESGANTIRLIDTMKESAENGGRVIKFTAKV